MKKTKIIRADGEFVSILEDGRRMMQAATGKKISTTRYTGELAQMMKPLVGMQKMMQDANKKKT